MAENKLSMESMKGTIASFNPFFTSTLVVPKMPIVPFPQATPVPNPPPSPPPPVPSAPAGSVNSPFLELPFPSPGDRIKSDDIKKISQCLRILYDSFILSSMLQSHTFNEARLALKAQQYQIQRVITVFGTVLDNPDDGALDNRKVLQVIPVELGQRQVTVVVTEAVETRRFAPNLSSLTYREATERVKLLVGDIGKGMPSRSVPSIAGLTLGQAREQLIRS